MTCNDGAARYSFAIMGGVMVLDNDIGIYIGIGDAVIQKSISDSIN